MKMYRFIKRVFDVIFSIILLIVLSPVFLVIALVIKAEDGGRVIYKHRRVGMYGREIVIYKFRSMVDDAEKIAKHLSPQQKAEMEREYKLDKDPRVTRVGDFLRRSSLDELPQLVNIIHGELSLVGPRPVTKAELLKYTDEQRVKFLSVKPGLTGYWQAYARNNATYSSGKRQEMELFYVDHAGIWFDIRILFRTVYAVFAKYGAK